jgi:hypothetical protein
MIHDIIAYKLVPLVYDTEFGNMTIYDKINVDISIADNNYEYKLTIINRGIVKYDIHVIYTYDRRSLTTSNEYYISGSMNERKLLCYSVYHAYKDHEYEINCKCDEDENSWPCDYCQYIDHYQTDIDDYDKIQCISYAKKYISGLMKRRYTGFHDISIKTE